MKKRKSKLDHIKSEFLNKIDPGDEICDTFDKNCKCFKIIKFANKRYKEGAEDMLGAMKLEKRKDIEYSELNKADTLYKHEWEFVGFNNAIKDIKKRAKVFLEKL